MNELLHLLGSPYAEAAFASTAANFLLVVAIGMGIWLTCKAVYAHALLWKEQNAQTEVQKQRRTVKPLCLQVTKGAILTGVVFCIGCIYRFADGYGSNCIAGDCLMKNIFWSAAHFMFLMTLLRAIDVTLKVVEYSKRKRDGRVSDRADRVQENAG